MPRDYFVGLDLGQAADYTALVVLERDMTDGEATTFAARHLERYPLHTSYPAIVFGVAELLARAPLSAGAQLVVDHTGVGRPIVDMLRRERLPGRMIPVTITGGAGVTKDPQGGYSVPKRELVSTTQVLLQDGRLKIAPELPHAATLVRELENFRVTISQAGHDSYAAWREGTHDDLVLALALAVWGGQRGQPMATAIARDDGSERGGWRPW